jgi:predicted TIM-barrel fold metal-dependent hydrolase
MQIIDSHAHIFPSKIAESAVRAISDFYEIPMRHSGEASDLLESGKKINVSKYVVFSTATTAAQVESINNFIISSCEEHDEFIGVGTMHPEYPHFEAELDRILKSGVRGVKLHPDFQRFNLDDERLYPVFSIMSNRDMFLITHSGDYRYDYSNPVRIARVAKMFPKLRIIAAHFGGYTAWQEAREHLKLENVYFDTSSTMGFIGYGEPRKALETFDTSRFFFGTDFPMWDHAEELDRLLGLGLSDDMLEKILYKNFMEFYHY